MGEGDANRLGRELWLSLVAEVLALPPTGIILGTLCLLAADLRKHPTRSTGILGIPLPALLSNTKIDKHTQAERKRSESEKQSNAPSKRIT